MVLFESVSEILECDDSNESQRVESSVMVVFMLYYRVLLTFESVYEIPSRILGMKSQVGFWV